jgi:hypothetical protein
MIALPCFQAPMSQQKSLPSPADALLNPQA